MIVLLIIGFLGGLVTGISPCILPVLPVIFAAGAASGLAEDSEPASPAAASTDDGPVLVTAGSGARSAAAGPPTPGIGADRRPSDASGGGGVGRVGTGSNGLAARARRNRRPLSPWSGDWCSASRCSP